ncbi:MAG TPA: four helix bundle protein, partial [Gemmatimonadales bacterium]|nr:four helix bundle protein [Gemmatimonadales bacterium]
MTTPPPSRLIRDFEDLLAWQEARSLHRAVVAACKNPQWMHRWGLKDQIKDAAVSVMANLAEGFERGWPKTFHQFVCFAKGSCGEVRSHIGAALEEGLITPDQASALRAQCQRTEALIGGLR